MEITNNNHYIQVQPQPIYQQQPTNQQIEQYIIETIEKKMIETEKRMTEIHLNKIKKTDELMLKNNELLIKDVKETVKNGTTQHMKRLFEEYAKPIIESRDEIINAAKRLEEMQAFESKCYEGLKELAQRIPDRPGLEETSNIHLLMRQQCTNIEREAGSNMMSRRIMQMISTMMEKTMEITQNQMETAKNFEESRKTWEIQTIVKLEEQVKKDSNETKRVLHEMTSKFLEREKKERKREMRGEDKEKVDKLTKEISDLHVKLIAMRMEIRDRNAREQREEIDRIDEIESWQEKVENKLKGIENGVISCRYQIDFKNVFQAILKENMDPQQNSTISTTRKITGTEVEQIGTEYQAAFGKCSQMWKKILEADKKLAGEIDVWIAMKKVRWFVENKEKYPEEKNYNWKTTLENIKQATSREGRIAYIAKPFMEKILLERERPQLSTPESHKIRAEEIERFAAEYLLDQTGIKAYLSKQLRDDSAYFRIIQRDEWTRKEIEKAEESTPISKLKDMMKVSDIKNKNFRAGRIINEGLAGLWNRNRIDRREDQMEKIEMLEKSEQSEEEKDNESEDSILALFRIEN